MEDQTVRTIDLRTRRRERELAGRDLCDELADCLTRFLAASADENTLRRSREALAVWHRLSEAHPVSAVY